MGLTGSPAASRWAVSPMTWQRKWELKRFRLSDMTVRFAEDKDFERVNELRRQVNDLHTEGRPDIFKLGFP